ncbi:MAG: outer membrane beta-barrel protein [Gammaproteobacteria bacterium]|nr:outer membrane beta-barrel protein [Gammaproteobacteria bacterium]
MKSFPLIPAAILAATAAFFTHAAQAVAVPNGALPGFYLGGQMGYTQLGYDDGDFTNSSSITRVNNDGIGGRVYFGYQINHYFGAEAGYTLYGMARVTGFNNNSSLGGDIRHQALDIVLKGTYPLVDSGFNIYGKAGVAFVKETASQTLITAADYSDNNATLFTYGAGATYNIWPQVPLEFSWTQVLHNNEIANSSLAAIGIGYYFG